jgi:hypothetical protein
MLNHLISVFFQTVKMHSDKTRIRVCIENMLTENTKLVVSKYGTYPYIYFIGINDKRDTLLTLIQLVCFMEYALIYHKETEKIYVAISEHSFVSGFNRFPVKIYNFKKTDIPKFGYRTFVSIANHKKYVIPHPISFSFCYLKSELSQAQIQSCEQILCVYRWEARREALLVASRVWNGRYFHVLKLIAGFL